VAYFLQLGGRSTEIIQVLLEESILVWFYTHILFIQQSQQKLNAI